MELKTWREELENRIEKEFQMLGSQSRAIVFITVSSETQQEVLIVSFRAFWLKMAYFHMGYATSERVKLITKSISQY